MADYDAFDALTIRRDGRLLICTLDRPDRLNAVSPDMHRQLEDLWYVIATDDSVGAVVLAGAGRAFCAGADVKVMSERLEDDDEADYQHRRAIRSYVPVKRLIANMLEVEQPIIAAVNGDAVGLGATLAFACDLVVANRTARFADTHVSNLGVTAGDGGTVFWPAMMGIHRAKEFLMSGDFLIAEDAARLGYINYAVDADDVMPKALELATKFAEGPTWAIRWTKTSINKILREQLNLTMDTARATQQLCFITEDHREAVAAFREKRKGNFRGV